MLLGCAQLAGLEHLRGGGCHHIPCPHSSLRWAQQQVALRAATAMPRARGAGPPPPRAAAADPPPDPPPDPQHPFATAVPWLQQLHPPPSAAQEPPTTMPPPTHPPAHPPPPPQPRPAGLVGFTAVVERRAPGRGALPTLEILGVVEGVVTMGAGRAARSLLRVVGPAGGGGGGRFGAGAAREEHLIPLVRSMVPRVDRAASLVVVDPPEGLLELGRRRVLLHHLGCARPPPCCRAMVPLHAAAPCRRAIPPLHAAAPCCRAK
jgi:hypothetical protein